MKTLSNNLINKIMLYVSHPCADIMRTCLYDKFDEVLMLKTQRKFIPKFQRHTMSFFEIRDNTTEEDEYSHEYNVFRNCIYYKLKVWAICEEDILMLCPEYAHFNKSLIHDLLNEDAERLEQARIEYDDDYDRADSDSSESYHSETENMRHLFITH